MAITDEEKLEIKQSVLDEIKTESQSVDELTEVGSLDGVNSLPAVKGTELVSVPIELLGKPATDAATEAKAAAAEAKKAAADAVAAKEQATAATTAASEATTAANEAAETANQAAADAQAIVDDVVTAKGGSTAMFSAVVAEGSIGSTDAATGEGEVVYIESLRRFAFSRGGIYYPNWDGDDMYQDVDGAVLTGKVFVCGDKLYVWSVEEGELVEVSGSGSGSGFYNVTLLHPLTTGYYTKDTAVAALADASVDDADKRGMIITFESAAGAWEEYRFVGTDISSFLTAASWEEYGGGKVKAISVNNVDIAPDADGKVNIAIDQISVDESLDAESTNPVQNAAVTAKVNELAQSTFGSIDSEESDGKVTISVYSKVGTLMGSTEFSGGGGGGGTSTASRIVITASVDNQQVKEGGNATLTYSYNHLNADGESDGVRANITITISRGTTQTYQQVLSDVSAGTYTLDISQYLLAGTVDIYVRASCVTAEGTQQTKQAYTSISVITLNLTSGYNLGSTIANGGYADGDTIEIPFTITGSGTKNVSMYLDGGETPTTQTITRAGTTNGSFTIQASTLAAGRHFVQLVAERNGLLSDSIYIDLLKAGDGGTFIGLRYTDTSGAILLGAGSTPVIKCGQYEQLDFNYIAYDPSVTPCSVREYQDGSLVRTLSVPRSQQTYTGRFTEQGEVAVEFRLGSTSYPLTIAVEKSSLDIMEATQALLFKLSAAGRSNGEENPAQWESEGVGVSFEGVDWQSSGWTGDALKLMNGAKAVIDYKPFAADIKSSGLTIELTMRVTNIADREGDVITCMSNGKGLRITASEASFLTGQTIEYTNEDDERVTREVKLSTKYTCDDGSAAGNWIKFALCVDTLANNALMHLYVNGNRTAADVYDTEFTFVQDDPQAITIDSTHADVELKGVRVYSRCVSDDEELENDIVDEESAGVMVERFEDNDILGDTGGVDIDKLLAKGKGVMRIIRSGKLDDIYATNNKSQDFQADIEFHSPFGEEYDFKLTNCNIRIQGTSSTKYPSKNIRIYFAKGGSGLAFTINGVADPYGKNKYKMRENSVPMNLFCMKSDYSDSSMAMNTGGAKLFNDMMLELGATDQGYLTPPQLHEYQQAGNSVTGIKVRQAIDGFPIDIFVAETEDGESEYVGQYNFNNEKSKSGTLFGMEGVDGYTPECPICLETLNNGEKACLFQSESDEDLAANFDNGMEFNYPEDTYWDAAKAAEEEGTEATEAQKAALSRLFAWIRSCVPDGADENDISTWASEKFKSEVSQYFSVSHLCAYYLWTDYNCSVDQRVKNMLLRTWDGLIWYLTYYDGDTQHGKRNDCFLVYDYTTDRDTWDAEAGKYAFEGHASWLWNLVLANLQTELRATAEAIRGVMTNTRVLDMFINEQSGNWSDRAFNKSGEIKYITPAVKEIYGKKWPFIYALQGSNETHRRYFLINRFALLDAKYGNSNFTADSVDFYMNRSASDAADVVRVTANEVYAFGYGTNNQANQGNTGIVQAGEEASLSITGAYTINDPLRLYGASRMRVLDLTGAASHLKNGLDLGKCDVLRELRLSTTTPSTGWWLVLSGCRQLRYIDLNGQSHAKTGGSTSTALDLSNQTRLEYLDARGTGVLSVNLAQGAPVSELRLPATLTTLRLEYLSQLEESGLTIDGYDSVESFRFASCPHIDWVSLLSKCVNVKRIRVTGIDMEGDGNLLALYLDKGGIDADGNAIRTCALVGNYRLTRYIDDDLLEQYRAHYPELNISQPEYTCAERDEENWESGKFSNLDNLTGYKFDKSYQPSGHLLIINAKRHRVMGKKTADGQETVYPLHDDNSNYYADADDYTQATPATLTGSDGDQWNYEPKYWYKGVNDLLNKKKYAFYNSSEDKDKVFSVAEHKRLYYGDMEVVEDMGVRAMEAYGTLGAAVAASTTYDYCIVDVTGGYKQVRYPSVLSATYGAVFLDASNNVIKRMRPSNDAGVIDGMYCFTSIPDGAAKLAFSVNKSAVFTYVLLTKGDKIADIEPDWVFHDECLCATQEALLRNDKLRSVSNVVSTGSISKADLEAYVSYMGKGFQLVDYEMSKDICNLFYAIYGEADSQLTCGPGTHNSGRTLGASNATGMQDTKPTAKDGDALPTINSDNYFPSANAYVLKSPDDEKRTAIGSPVCMGYENWYGGKAEWMGGIDFNRDSVDYVWRIKMPDGVEREVQGLRQSGPHYPLSVIHERYMDTLAAYAGGSTTTGYFDLCNQGGGTARVVFRSYNNAYANGGVSYANAVYDSAYVNASIGSRLAFRGEIVWAASAAAFKSIEALE